MKMTYSANWKETTDYSTGETKKTKIGGSLIVIGNSDELDALQDYLRKEGIKCDQFGDSCYDSLWICADDSDSKQEIKELYNEWKRMWKACNCK